MGLEQVGKELKESVDWLMVDGGAEKVGDEAVEELVRRVGGGR
jgi:hypothetical protein